MSDYWVKPTIEQLQAELAWERGQEVIRRKRRRFGTSLAAAVVVVILAVAAVMPHRSAVVSQGYAMETTTAAEELTEAEPDMAAERSDPEQDVPETEGAEQPADETQQG